MSTYIHYPASGGGSGGVATYANFASLPASASNGTLAITLDTGFMYEYRTGSASWVLLASPSAALSIGTFDSGTPSANGAHIDTGALIMQSASGTNPGLVNISTQTMLGAKTFTTSVATAFFSSTAANPATAGTLRLGNAQSISWRDVSNASNKSLTLDSSNIFQLTSALTITGNLAATNFSGSSSGSNTGDVTLAAIGSSPNANAASLSGQILNLQPANASFGGVVSTIAQTFAGAKTFSSLINADGGIDISASGTLTIGATNSSTINIGNSGATVNIQGTTIYENTPQLLVADPLITVNTGGGAASGQNSGIEINENNVITGYAETSSDRNSWILKAPNTAGVVTITPGVSGFTINQASHNPVTLGAFGSTPNANGLSLSTQVLNMQPADATNPGGVSTTTQTFAGAKTFANALSIADGTVSLPGLYFDTHTTTGWYAASADTVSLAVSAANVATYSSTGLALTPKLTLTGGTVTTSIPVLDITQTWNQGATTFTGIKANFTASAAAAASKLIDIQKAGTSQFNVDRDGNGVFFGHMNCTGGAAISGLGSDIYVGFGSTPVRIVDGGSINSGGAFLFTVNTNSSAVNAVRIDTSGNVGIMNNAPGALLDLGLAGTTKGVLRFAGNTSGNVTIQPAAAAGTWALTLPITAGTANYALTTNGSGVSTWSQISLTAAVTGTLPIANGGTNATTKAAAFDSLSPMTTGGDIIYGGASGTGTRLANGTAGQVLTSSGTTAAPTWSPASTLFPTASKTSNYNSNAGEMVLCDASGGSFTVTVPSVSVANTMFAVYRTDTALANSVTVSGGGVTTTKLMTAGEAIYFVSNGTTWFPVSRSIPSVTTAYTPAAGTVTTNATYTGFWKRMGDWIQCDVKVAFSGANTQGILTFAIPTGLTIDSAKLTDATAVDQDLGPLTYNTGAAVYYGRMSYNDTTTLTCRVMIDDSGPGSLYVSAVSVNTNVNAPDVIANGYSVNAIFRVPIVDWAG